MKSHVNGFSRVVNESHNKFRVYVVLTVFLGNRSTTNLLNYRLVTSPYHGVSERLMLSACRYD
jgi:hypothetical protein